MLYFRGEFFHATHHNDALDTRYPSGSELKTAAVAVAALILRFGSWGKWS